MTNSAIEVDYLIVGAGATGMAFADSLLSSSDATMAIVDRRDRPGGHWNDAYPFVRLHQPPANYGVNSLPLGTGAIDAAGTNAGLYELATGPEVLAHFDLCMRHRLLPSGRVQFLPMTEMGDDGTARSLLSGRRTSIMAGKVVDTTHAQISVPSRHVRPFTVAPGVACVPVNDLPRVAADFASYVVVGAGKTGMDACVWLLEHGVDPDRIRWIMPRDSWLLDRGNYQPGVEFLERSAKSLADQVEALALAESVDDLFVRLEEAGELRRLDRSVVPTAYHCATASDGELALLRCIAGVGGVVRLGRVLAIDSDRIILERGEIPTSADCLYVDCSAVGIPPRPTIPVFDRDRITVQSVRLCQPAFSAAFIAHIEATFDDDAVKNELCTPVPTPTVPLDWVRMMAVELSNRYRWSKVPEIDTWRADARLDGMSRHLRSLTGAETDIVRHLQRYVQYVGQASANAHRLLEPVSLAT